MTLRRLLFVASLLTASGMAASVPVSSRAIVSEESVLAALKAAGVPVRSAEVKLLAPVVLKQISATLRLERLEPWQGESALAKINCAYAGECVPFLVILRWNDPQERDAALGSIVKSAVSRRVLRSPSQPTLVHAGQQATLLMQNGRMRIATQVICLESGKQGQEIRITGLNRQKISAAEVVEAGVLKGNL